MYVRRLNNYQNSLLPTFLEFFKIFQFLQKKFNGFFDHVRKLLQMCACMLTQVSNYSDLCNRSSAILCFNSIFCYVLGSHPSLHLQFDIKNGFFSHQVQPSFTHGTRSLICLYFKLQYFCCCISDIFCMLYVFIRFAFCVFLIIFVSKLII